MEFPEAGDTRWPAHLPVGALRVVRWSANYDQTVSFYRDTIGLAVLETFQASYGLDGTILGLPDGPVHLEIVRLPDARRPAPGLDQLVFYLPDAAAQEGVKARFAASGVLPVPQIDYWEAHGGEPGLHVLARGGIGQVEHQLIESGGRAPGIGQPHDLQVNRAARQAKDRPVQAVAVVEGLQHRQPDDVAVEGDRLVVMITPSHDTQRSRRKVPWPARGHGRTAW